MAHWLGKFEAVNIDEKAKQFLISAGYPKNIAQKLGPTISTITFAEDGDGYVQTIDTPSVGCSTALRFKLGQEAEIPGKDGILVKCFFNWDETSRTLQSRFQIGNGSKFTLDFVFSEDYNSAVKYRRTAAVEAKKLIKRV